MTSLAFDFNQVVAKVKSPVRKGVKHVIEGWRGRRFYEDSEDSELIAGSTP